MQTLIDFLMIFLVDVWSDFCVILDVFCDEKPESFFRSIFGRVIFASRECGADATRLQRDFSRGAYGPDAPQAAPRE